MTIKWSTNNDHSNADYDVGGEIIYNTDVLTSNICDFNDAYILVRGDITIIEHRVTKVALHHLLDLLRKLMEQQWMMLKI